MKVPRVTYVCDICDIHFKTMFNFKRHLESKRHKHNCSASKESDLMRVRLDETIVKFKIDGDLNPQACSGSVLQSSVNEFRCKFCCSSFKRKSHLTQHLRVHEEVKNFECQLCQSKFKYKHVLERHIKAKHTLKTNILILNVV